MTHTKEQLIDALVCEYQFLIHDDFDPVLDSTPEEYRSSLESLGYDELVEETGTDDHFTLDEFMNCYGSN